MWNPSEGGFTPLSSPSAGGGSVILITDGEESCKGNPQSAARQIKASGVKVTLNIVGFTLTGKGVVSLLRGAERPPVVTRHQARRAAAPAVRRARQVRQGAGVGESSELSRELPAGEYRVRIEALGQKLEEAVTIVPDQTTTISLAVEGDRFVVKRR